MFSNPLGTILGSCGIFKTIIVQPWHSPSFEELSAVTGAGSVVLIL